MLKRLLAGIACTAAIACATSAGAVTFTASGHVDYFTATIDGLYEIDAWGAQGGSYYPSSGGLGAMVGGNIFLHSGDTLGLVVGGIGTDVNGNTGAGGGGGSFVFVSSDLQLLLAAGGGGGAGWNGPSGKPGLTGINGGDGGSGAGGVAGLGGHTGNGYSVYDGTGAGGGAGWLGPGQDGHPNNDGYGIYGTGGLSLYSFQGGSTYGCIPYAECESGPSGGFGGGGGASYNLGGGGGGYSGGGSGGGGGGSYVSDEFTDVVALSGVRSGNGLISINLLPVPEPATWAMMLAGFLGLGLSLRRHRASQLRTAA